MVFYGNRTYTTTAVWRSHDLAYSINRQSGIHSLAVPPVIRVGIFHEDGYAAVRTQEFVGSDYDSTIAAYIHSRLAISPDLAFHYGWGHRVLLSNSISGSTSLGIVGRPFAYVRLPALGLRG